MPSRFSSPLFAHPGEQPGVPRSPLLYLLPWTVWLLALVAEVLTGHCIRLSPVLAAVPPLAALAHGWRAVVLSGALAWLSQLAFRWIEPPPPEDASPLTTGIAMIGITCASALGCMARQRGEERIRRMRSLAGGVQRAVLRPIPPQIGGYRVSGFYQAAEHDARVGGDFYEALETPYGLRIVLGDVSGKGLTTVDATVTLLGAFREAAEREEDPADVARWMDRSLARRQRATGDHRFATALIVEAHPGGRLRLVNCGHVPPWQVDADGATELALPPGALLGLFDHLLTEPLATVPHTLAPSASLLAVTDGVTEARDAARAFYDPAGTLRARGLGACPTAVRDAVLTGLAHHTGGRLSDDAAALVLAGSDGSGRTIAAGSGGDRPAK
ncbi:PP2C family protein-serine/threonine phosphatase [Streptomyces sp. NPDC004111]|uniref:PP2C family protein-serine/threonine phosphatase n=1 Tax=Streptomyces sp. NPDC004111 TaxID=3364690 RepID=UPI00368F64C5